MCQKNLTAFLRFNVQVANAYRSLESAQDLLNVRLSFLTPLNFLVLYFLLLIAECSCEFGQMKLCKRIRSFWFEMWEDKNVEKKAFYGKLTLWKFRFVSGQAAHGCNFCGGCTSRNSGGQVLLHRVLWFCHFWLLTTELVVKYAAVFVVATDSISFWAKLVVAHLMCKVYVLQENVIAIFLYW